MQKTIQIRGLDCAACAEELGELLKKIEGVDDATVDFVGSRVALNYQDEQALARAEETISTFEEVEIVREGTGKQVIKIRNLDCANCAREMQEELEEIEGIASASVDFVGQRVELYSESKEAFQKAIYLISHFEEVEIVDGNAPVKKERHLKELISISLSLLFFIPAFILERLSGINEWISFGLYLASFLAAGWPVIFSVFNIPQKIKQGIRGFLFDENTLMLIAGVGAFAIRQNMEGAAVMLLYEIGEYLQAIAVGSSRNAISRLTELKSDTAILLIDGGQKEVPSEELKIGDRILVRKGDRLPADCTLLDDSAQLDTKSLTGEAYLKEVVKGGELLAGFVNEGAAFRAEVLRPVSESAVQKILETVEGASAKKAKPEKFITRFARYYTPIVVIAAVLLAVIPPLFDGYNFSRWIQTALNFLVISCPCALIISVPLTYFSGIGSLARVGVLAKGSTYLDTLAHIKIAAFDKTGTLTEGKFSIAKVNGEDRTLAVAAAVEKLSSHPLARAFAEVETGEVAEDCREIAGKGLSAVVGGKTVLVGSARLMTESGVAFEPIETLHSVIYVEEEGKLLGSVEIEDALRSDTQSSLSELSSMGVTTAVLTGDSRARAELALKELKIGEIHADLLPAEKLTRVEELKKRGTLLYVGDGINDSPAMAVSDVAVAMGALGSDAAIEASDLVLVSDSLSALPRAVRTAKKTKKIVFENIVFSIAVKLVLMGLSVAGLIPLWLAVLGDVGVMLIAVLNSMRMRLKIK